MFNRIYQASYYTVGVWFQSVNVCAFVMMLTLYPDGRLTGFAKATKTSGAAKLYWRRLNSFLCWSGLLKEDILKDSNFFL